MSRFESGSPRGSLVHDIVDKARKLGMAGLAIVAGSSLLPTPASARSFHHTKVPNLHHVETKERRLLSEQVKQDAARLVEDLANPNLHASQGHSDATEGTDSYKGITGYIIAINYWHQNDIHAPDTLDINSSHTDDSSDGRHFEAADYSFYVDPNDPALQKTDVTIDDIANSLRTARLDSVVLAEEYTDSTNNDFSGSSNVFAFTGRTNWAAQPGHLSWGIDAAGSFSQPSSRYEKGLSGSRHDIKNPAQLQFLARELIDASHDTVDDIDYYADTSTAPGY